MSGKAIFTGSFDPITLGHSDIIRRAARVFDELEVAVVGNPNKRSLLSAAERMELIREELAWDGLGGVVKVGYVDGLLADYIEKNRFNVIVRGLRGAGDLEYETQMVHINNKLVKGGVETVFFVCDPALTYISSSMVREVFSLGGSIDGLVSDRVLEFMNKKR